MKAIPGCSEAKSVEKNCVQSLTFNENFSKLKGSGALDSILKVILEVMNSQLESMLTNYFED